jgi:hypothetical protein
MRRRSLPAIARSALLVVGLAASLPLATLGARLLFDEPERLEGRAPSRRSTGFA